MNEIAEDTPTQLLPVIKELYTCLFDKKKRFTSFKGFESVNDNGIGSFRGLDNCRIFNLTYKGKRYDFGLFNYIRPNGNTIGIRDGETDSNFIQYVLDKYIIINDQEIIFTHDGVITGSSGKSKKECIEEIEKNAPQIVGEVNNKKIIKLGNLKEGFKFEDEDFREFVGNFLEYSILRNNFKKDNKVSKSEKKRVLNYWIFQGNPKYYDVVGALQNNHVQTWKVAAHKDKIKVNDKIILWLSGENAGCYALAKVVSDVGKNPNSEAEIAYYKSEYDENEDRVQIEIEYNLWDKPILWDSLKNDESFLNFNGGNQGTNFSATEEEYQSLVDISTSNDDNVYEEVKRTLNQEKLKQYLRFLRKFVMDSGISYYDERISFNVRKNRKRLAFIISNRYAFSIQKNKNETEFIFITNKPVVENSGEYRNSKSEVESFWNHSNHILNFDKDINEGLIKELSRNYKSPARKYTNKDFISDIFQINKIMDSPKLNNYKAPLNQILYGPPGTGKTFNSINKAIEIINPNFDLSQSRSEIKKEYDRLLNDGQIVFTTFHQSMSYEDFIEGIKPKIDENENEEKQVIYEVENGIFKQLVDRAKKYKTESQEVVEEHVFEKAWEKLIELVKSKISVNELVKIGSWEYGLSTKDSLKYTSVNTPSLYTFTITKQNIFDAYHNKKARPSGAFQKDMLDIVEFLKSNFQLSDYSENITLSNKVENSNQNYVIIIDEINRGNVSAIFGELITLIEEDKRMGKYEALEVMLPYSKEKFGVPPNVYIIGTMNTADRSVEALDTALRRRFSFVEMMPCEKVIEEKAFSDFDRVFIMQKINQRIELLLDRNYTLGHSYFIKIDFKKSFENEIIPLLQEYFYNDYGKIGLVLGRGFVREKAISTSNSVFADFETKNDIDVAKGYELIPFNEVNFDLAIETLLGN